MSQINDVIEVEQLTGLWDNVVESQQVDASILLSTNNVDGDNEEELKSEENVESSEDNEDYEDIQFE